MCVCVNPRSTEAANKDRLEDENVVELLVGDPPWRYSARRAALAQVSPVFEANFYGPLAIKDNTLLIPDVDPRAFQAFLWAVEGKPIKLRSVATALSTLYLAHKYLLPDLVEQCVQYLTNNLQKDSVLEVFKHARLYSSSGQLATPRGSPERTPSAPLENELPPEPPGVAGWSAVLLSRCLDFIDVNGEEVLTEEEMEELPRDALKELLRRDSLCCSELTVLHVLERWADCECRRQKLIPSAQNRRHVLGDLFYLARLPLLTADEFIKGPLQSELLSTEETKLFSALVAKTKQPTVPAGVESHLPRMTTPRTPQASSSDLKKDDSRRRSKGWRRKKSREEKGEKGEKGEKTKRCSGSCLTDTLVDVLVCIFD